MPYFFADVGISSFFIGIVYTAIAVSRAFSSLLGGRIADRYGRKPIISLGYALYTIGILIILISASLIASTPILTAPLSIIGYMLLSAGGGLQGPASSMLLVESSPEKRRGLSYMITTRFLPSIPPAALILIGTQLYLTNHFWLALTLGLLGLLSVLLLFSFGLIETHSPVEPVLDSFPRPARYQFDLFVLLLIAAFALDGISSSGLSWYVPIFVGRSNMDLYGVMISVSTLVIAVSALISGGLVDKIGTRAAIFGGWMFLAITVALFPFGTNPFEIVILYSIWSGLDMVDISVPPLAIAERYPQAKRASVMGTYSMSISLLGMVGPALISFSLLLGENVPFYLKAAMNLAGAFLFLLAFRTEKADDELQKDQIVD